MSLKVYRGRTLARSQALQLLFQAEATDSPLERVLEGDFLISKGPLDPYALELCRGAYEHIDRIDCALRAVAKNWDLMRMPGADRNLLRIAVYEMRFLTDEEVSDAIVINEAVEIAKAYGTDQSASFVNGVLGKIARSEECRARDLYQGCWPRIVLARRHRLPRRPPRSLPLRLPPVYLPRMRTL
ncbi:MAG: transcription antitermination factor NusB [Collinsella sp.]